MIATTDPSVWLDPRPADLWQVLWFPAGRTDHGDTIPLGYVRKCGPRAAFERNGKFVHHCGTGIHDTLQQAVDECVAIARAEGRTEEDL